MSNTAGGVPVFDPNKLRSCHDSLNSLLAIEPPPDNPHLVEACNTHIQGCISVITEQINLGFTKINEAELTASSLAHVMSGPATRAYMELKGILPPDDPNILAQKRQRQSYVDALWEIDDTAGEILEFVHDDRRPRLEGVLGIVADEIVLPCMGDDETVTTSLTMAGPGVVGREKGRRAPNVSLTADILARFDVIDQLQYPKGFARSKLVAMLGINDLTEGQQTGIIRRLLGDDKYPGNPVRMVAVGKGAGTKYMKTLPEIANNSTLDADLKELDNSTEPFSEQEALLLATILSLPSVQHYLVNDPTGPKLEPITDDVLAAFGDLDYEQNADRLPEDRAVAFEKIARLLDPDESGEYRKLDTAIKQIGNKGNRREPLLAYFYFQTIAHKNLGDIVRSLLDLNIEVFGKLNLRKRGSALEEVRVRRIPRRDITPATIAERVAPRQRDR